MKKMKLTGNCSKSCFKNNKNPLKYIYAISSVDEKTEKRWTWSFWSTKEKAINDGIKGWRNSDGSLDLEFYSEQCYYSHIIVEKIALDYPLYGIKEIEWFKMIPLEISKTRWVKKYKLEKCGCPENFINVIGFYG